MKVLILSFARTGSTRLTKGLSSIFKLRMVSEKWHPHNPSDDKFLNLEDNYIEKCMLNQKPKDEKSSNIEFYLNYYKNFDHTIILGRKDINLLTESLVYATNKYGKWSGNWQDKYTIEENSDMSGFYEYKKYVNTWMLRLQEFSKKTNIPMTWYEELYSGNLDIVKNTVENWGFNVDISKLAIVVNPIYKLRK